MVRIVVEDDAILRIVPVILDSRISTEHRHAVADFFAHDEPDFAGWCDGLRQRIPGLYPAEIVFATDQADLRAKLAEADGVIVETLKIGDVELAAAPRLKVVQKFGAIAANIDAAACARRGVPVETLRRRVNIAVAEQAIALMIGLAKRLCELNGVVEEAALRQAGFDPTPFDRRYTGNSNFARIRGLRTLHGGALGLIGMGEIGREVARMAAGFQMTIRYYQRTPLPAAEEAAFGARYALLSDLLEQSDYVSIQLPMTAATRGIIGATELQRLKPGAIVVNAARAELIDRQALLAALDAGRLGGFGLDVGYEEPARPGERLLGYKNVLYMPHTAVAARQNGLADMEELCVKLWRHVAALRS